MKLLSYGLLAVLAFSAWADNRTKRSGTKLTRNRLDGQGQNRIISVGSQIGRNGNKRRLNKKRPNNATRKHRGKRINRYRPKAQRFGRLGQIKPGKGQRKASNLIRNKEDGKPQRPVRNKATKKVREQRRQAARNGKARNGRKIKKNSRTGQGYYQNDYYYYYDDPSQGATDPAATGYYDPEEYPVVTEGSENCAPVSERITYWDNPDVAMQAIPGLTEEDAALLLEDVKALTYGNTGKFLMQNGGVVSYTSKSHSLIVNEICQGTGGTDYPYVYPTDGPIYGGGEYDNEQYDSEVYPANGGYRQRNGVKKDMKKRVKNNKKVGRKMANKNKGRQ